VIVFAAAIVAAFSSSASPLVAFRQTGGIAGFDRGLVVRQSGKVVSQGLPLVKTQLSAAELAALRSALTAARFPALPDVYKPKVPIADGFTYRIAYGRDAVRIEQGAKPPRRVQRVFDLLLRLTR
jgi:hypothetical protein